MFKLLRASAAILLALIGLNSYALEPATSGDSFSVQIKSSEPPIKRYNPVLAAGGSLIVPGGGLFFCNNPVRAGVYLLTGAAMGGFAYNRYDYSQMLGVFTRRWQDSINTYALLRQTSLTALDSTRYDTAVVRSQLRHDLALFDQNESYTTAINGAYWLGGLYVYGIMDALEQSKVFYSVSSRDPAIAGWLSAIPGLGLGQIYNGAVGKAGMIFMVQSALLFMAYNYHQLMVECESQDQRLQVSGTIANRYSSELSDDWQWRRNNSFNKRNSYLWYSLMFYFYGIFDAIVDAHLHDMPAVMNIGPDLTLRDGAAVGVKATIDIKDNK